MKLTWCLKNVLSLTTRAISLWFKTLLGACIYMSPRPLYQSFPAYVDLHRTDTRCKMPYQMSREEIRRLESERNSTDFLEFSFPP
jgi:hypothetical protein